MEIKGGKSSFFSRLLSDKQDVGGGGTADEMNDGKCSPIVLLYNAKTDGTDCNSHKSPPPHEPGDQSVHAVTPRLPIGQLAPSIRACPRARAPTARAPGRVASAARRSRSCESAAPENVHKVSILE